MLEFNAPGGEAVRIELYGTDGKVLGSLLHPPTSAGVQRVRLAPWIAPLRGMGWLRLNTGAGAESVELFEQALDRRHDHVAAANGLASAYKRLGRVDDAIRVWQDLAKRAPSSGVGQFGLAQTYLEQSKFDKALPLFEQLAATMPNKPVVQEGLVRARSGARR